MPFFDRHRRLRWLGVVLAGVAAVLFPFRYLQVAAIWDSQRGWDMQLDYIFAACSAVVLAVVALFLARSALRARDRMQWRMDVLSGVIPAPPRSSHPVSSATDSPKHHVIVQRVGKANRAVGWMFVPLFIICLPITIAAILALSLDVLINPADRAFQGETIRAFGLVIIAPIMPFSLWLFGTFASAAWIRSPRYEVDQFGLTWQPRRGRSITIRWQDARLLEASTYYQPEAYSIERKMRYLLHGNNDIIRIDGGLGNHRVAIQLLDIIEERTGLAPCSLAQPSVRERIFQLFHLPYVEP